jgi:hypothetical protein
MKMHHELIHKMLCAALIMTLAMMLCTLCVAPAFADTYSLAITWNIYAVSYNQETLTYVTFVAINGTLTDVTTGTPCSNLPVNITITDLTNNFRYGTSVTTDAAGTYRSNLTFTDPYEEQIHTAPPTYTISSVAFSNGVQIATASENFTIAPMVVFCSAGTISPAQTLNSTGATQTSFASGATITISFVLTVGTFPGYLISFPVEWTITIKQGTTIYNIVNVPATITSIFPTLIKYSQLMPVDYPVGTWTATIQVFRGDLPIAASPPLNFTVT